MAIYQCFFFSEKRIRNWENVECETNSSLRTLIARRLVNGAWDAAEGWLQDKLVYRVERRLAGYNGSCSPAAVPVACPHSGPGSLRFCISSVRS